MKINNGGSNNVEALKAYGTAATDKTQQAADTGERQKNATIIQDKINISSKVRMYQDIKEAALEAPDIRTEKVDGVASEIASGTYKPDYGAIADKLLSPNISSKI